ncbi:ribonuclease P protein component [Actinomyces sp. 2119]|uniref:Ribonuclease P protein component n=1 Tax=Actinomyces lilanjuaniae TaxID=2321394 RepID=A0ABN5PQL5_9ACTO|nr:MULTISPECIES: ribonuclease P protein component [Actinomyces]AYD90685.1 ribonuclease P protein component [Actinomyces lilanjuaniae]RJF43849.1 ribonuclease P protein component [Actinomyces sp. 2119]
MLDARNRLVRGDDFSSVIRGGVRSGSRNMVLYLYLASSGEDSPTRIGLTVSKKQIPLATHRNRVKRRLRGLLSSRVELMQPGSRLIVRVLSSADGIPSADLGKEFDALLRKCHHLYEKRPRQ